MSPENPPKELLEDLDFFMSMEVLEQENDWASVEAVEDEANSSAPIETESQKEEQ